MCVPHQKHSENSQLEARNKATMADKVDILHHLTVDLERRKFYTLDNGPWNRNYIDWDGIIDDLSHLQLQ